MLNPLLLKGVTSLHIWTSSNNFRSCPSLELKLHTGVDARVQVKNL